MINILTPFLINFGPTWIDFGRILAPKLEPSWDEMCIKSNPKTNQKIDFFLEGFQFDFGWILVPSWDPRGGVTWNAFWVSWGVLARWSQEAPRAPQTTHWCFVIFLVDFWQSFGRFLFESWCVGVLGCWLPGSLFGLFAQLVIGWGSLHIRHSHILRYNL